MQVEIKNENNLLIAGIQGRIDATTVGNLENSLLTEAKQEVSAVLVDFTEVEYISSAGLRAILKLAKLCQGEKKQLRLYGMQNSVFEVFKISGFSGIIKILPDKEQALQSL